MAGQPKKQQLIAALERLARAEFGDEQLTHLDFVEHWQACGKTLNGLGELAGLGIDQGEFISRYLKRTFGPAETLGRLSGARARGAHRMVERSLKVAENATSEDVAASGLLVRTLQWTAERFNQAELGVQRGPAITVNIGTLMLEALRQPPPPLAPTAIASVIADDAIVLSIDAPTTYVSEQRTIDPLLAIEPAMQ